METSSKSQAYSPPPAITLCPLCSDIILHPVLCENCDNCFCSTCIENYTKAHGGQCRFCEKFVKRPFKPTSAIGKALGELKFFCKFRNSGCGLVLPYSVFLQHEKECEYQPINCPNQGCKVPVTMKNMEYHLTVCDFGQVGCKYCGLKHRRRSLEAHQNTCDYIIIQCEDCGQKMIKRDQKAHMGKCEEGLISCPECDSVFIRKDKTKHSCIKALKGEIELLKEKLKRLESLLLARPAEEVKTDYEEDGKGKMLYCWPNGSNVFKVDQTSWVTFLATNVLPKYFQVTIKIIDLPGTGWDCDGGIGVSRTFFKPTNMYMGFYVGQYGIMTTFKGISKKFSEGELGAEYGVSYKKGDIIKMIYDKKRSLSYEINGKSQGIAFSEIEGPFYLMATLFFAGSSIEIVNVEAIS